MPSSTTDFGTVRDSIVTRLKAQLNATTEARSVKGARTERAADDAAKGYNSVYVVDRGSQLEAPGEDSNNGYLKQWERRTYDILIYAQSGKDITVDEAALMTLSARVKFIASGFTPAGQVNANGSLELLSDLPVEEYINAEGVGLKVRQTYELPLQLWSQIT